MRSMAEGKPGMEMRNAKVQHRTDEEEHELQRLG